MVLRPSSTASSSGGSTFTPLSSQPSFEQPTTANDDFIITKEKRQQPRELQLHPKPINLGGGPDRNGSSLSEQEREVYHMDVDDAVRWSTFLTGLVVEEIVASISDKHNANKEEHQLALTKAVEAHEIFRTDTCGHLIEYAVTLMEVEDIWELDDAAFKKHISASFTAEKFFAAFNFLEDHLVIPNSTARGKWYANAVWTSMIIRLRDHFLRRSGAGRWTQFANTFATIALSDHYDDIKITDFSQISPVYRLQKKQLREKIEAVRSITSPIDPMPAKEEPAPPSLTKVIENSANSEARLADLYHEDVSSTYTSPNTPTSHARSTNPPVSGTSTPIFDDGGFGHEFIDEDGNVEKGR
jgi:hypothetical protein